MTTQTPLIPAKAGTQVLPSPQSPPAPRWKLFTICDNAGQFPPYTYTHQSKAKATWSVYRELREAYPDITFPEFLRRFSVIRVPDNYVRLNDAYDYVRNHYGISVTIGQRVQIGGRWGTIVYPNRSTTHMLHVAFDHRSHAVLCHPLDLKEAAA